MTAKLITVTGARRKAIDAFENAVADLIDQHLRDGLDPEWVKAVLENQSSSDLASRKIELQSERTA